MVQDTASLSQKINPCSLQFSVTGPANIWNNTHKQRNGRTVCQRTGQTGICPGWLCRLCCHVGHLCGHRTLPGSEEEHEGGSRRWLLHWGTVHASCACRVVSLCQLYVSRPGSGCSLWGFTLWLQIPLHVPRTKHQLPADSLFLPAGFLSTADNQHQSGQNDIIAVNIWLLL